ncbi:MAG: AAA family ATPase [bacterium]|nr:AAA family ATPase [bacterium]
MRILAIRGHNLASLAREFEVDLVDGNLGGAGIFAICGPVGAGKSTLLDALCLALFDRTPRLSGRGGVAVAEIERPEKDWLHSHDPRSLLRRGAGEGYAEVDFSGRDGRRYRARWSVRRARRRADGRVQAQEMTLHDLDRDRAVARGGKGEVLAAIRARLGLDFAQFCRSVLLAQGDFAAFLRAPADERASLLESLTGADVYRRLSRAAHERSKTARQNVERLEAQIDGLEPLADEERDRLRAELAALEAQRRVNELAVGLAQSVVSWYAAAADARAEESKATAELERARAARLAAEPRRQQVVALGRALPLVPRLERVAAAQREVVQAVATSEQVAREQAQLVGDLERARERLGERLLATFGTSVAPPIVEERERWRAVQERWQRLERAWLEFEVDREGAHSASRRAAAAEQAARAAIEDPLFRQLPALRQQVVADRSWLERLQDAVRNWQSADAELRRQREEVARRSGERDALRDGFERLVLAQRDAEQRLVDARAAVEHERLRGDLAAFRSHLEPGHACPLCGSEEHPSPVAADRNELEALTAGLVAAQEARDRSRDAVAAREAARRECERGIELAQQRLAAMESTVTAAADQYHVLAERLARERSSTLSDRDDVAGERESGRRLDRCAGADSDASDSEADATANASAGVGTNAEDVTSAGATHAAGAGACHPVDARTDAGLDAFARFVNSDVTADSSIAATAIAELSEDLAARDRRVAAMSDRLEAGRTALALAERQAHRAAAAVDAMRELEAAEAELAPAWGAIEDWRTRVASLGARVTAELDFAAAAAAHCTDLANSIERQAASLAATSRERTRCEQELAAANAAFQSELATVDLQPATVREAADLGGDRVRHEAEQLRELSEAEREARAVLKKCVELRRRHEDTNRPAIIEDDATRALEDAREARESTEVALNDLNARLGADGMLRQRRAEIAPHLESARQKLEVWAALDELIGHSRGDRFAVFAQSLTLDLLLLEANHRLAELAPRFRLEKNHGRDMDFIVVDLELGGVRRGLQSLSGGETFLVSLSLALALASLAAPRSRVETLFLDEGFGTLDASHLEAALGALDSLQAAGCQIGIISHVEGIAERIGAVVDVRPDGGGQSRITVRTS